MMDLTLVPLARRNQDPRMALSFNLPGTNQELITIYPPSEDEINELNRKMSKYVDQFSSITEGLVDSVLDVVESARPELKDNIQDLRELWVESDQDRPTNEELEKLNQLGDDERIKAIINRTMESEDRLKKTLSQARQAQNKLSGSAKIERMTEEVHALRKTIVRNLTDNTTNVSTKTKICAVDNAIDSLVEGVGNYDFEQLLSSFVGEILFPGEKSTVLSIEEIVDQTTTTSPSIIEEIVDQTTTTSPSIIEEIDEKSE
jgi:hypothetical protein